MGLVIILLSVGLRGCPVKVCGFLLHLRPSNMGARARQTTRQSPSLWEPLFLFSSGAEPARVPFMFRVIWACSRAVPGLHRVLRLPLGAIMARRLWPLPHALPLRQCVSISRNALMVIRSGPWLMVHGP